MKPLCIKKLLDEYRSDKRTPTQLMEQIADKMESCDDEALFITPLSREQMLAYANALKGKALDDYPLYGIPFAIKDNIDLAGIPTTVACPDYAYTPTESAFVVQKLIEAGAIPIGKMNLDQFATGLVGVRSPYGTPKNSINPDYIPGGSSSGSAVAVANGYCSFSLGTDTAGSGRVPAGFNNIVGVKPTKGLLSTSGVVPACRSLDCVSIFALDEGDAERVLSVASGYDEADSFSRPVPAIPEISTLHNPQNCVIGVPRGTQREFFGNTEYARLYEAAIQSAKDRGYDIREIDIAPLLEAARLLYEGPWVTERYVAIEDFIKDMPESLHPVTHKIISGGEAPKASDGFKASYRLAELRRKSEQIWNEIDTLMLPTTGTIYKVTEVEADPVVTNSNLGHYTNFMNLLDLAALAAPAGFTNDGLPFGITLIAPAFHDEKLLSLSCALKGHEGTSTKAESAGRVQLAVCGAHLEGCPLNWQLTDRGAKKSRPARVHLFISFMLCLMGNARVWYVCQRVESP